MGKEVVLYASCFETAALRAKARATKVAREAKKVLDKEVSVW